MQWRVVAAILFALVVAVFAVVNVHAEPVDFVFVRVHVPLVLIILGAALCGGLAVFAVGLASRVRLVRETRTLRAQLEEVRGHGEASADLTTPSDAVAPAQAEMFGATVDGADGSPAPAALQGAGTVPGEGGTPVVSGDAAQTPGA
ncbi:MAG: LapA family protein [Firmicutes bacterium]|nr:LapA family protein [Bacillota bacterium]